VVFPITKHVYIQVSNNSISGIILFSKYEYNTKAFVIMHEKDPESSLLNFHTQCEQIATCKM